MKLGEVGDEVEVLRRWYSVSVETESERRGKHTPFSITGTSVFRTKPLYHLAVIASLGFVAVQVMIHRFVAPVLGTPTGKR